jgi:recombination protein RecT
MATVNETKAMVEQKKQETMQALIERSSKELGRALPAHLNSERLVRIALTCIRQVPDLALCTPASFLGALFTAAQVGIEPIAGRAYLIPFNNSRKNEKGEWRTVKECQLIIGYKGLVEMFYRHASAIQLDWGVVHDNDDFKYSLGTNAALTHYPSLKDRGDAVAYWAMATLKGGGKPFVVMSKAQCIDHGQKHSKTWDKRNGKFYDNSPWSTNFDAMALKTVFIQLAKLLPLSVELQTVIQQDETSRDYTPGTQNILDVPATTNWNEPDEPVEEKKPVAPGKPVPAPAPGNPGKAEPTDMDFDGIEPSGLPEGRK